MANPQQEELAQTLGAVLTKQVTREDIVPEAVITKLADPEFNTFL